MLLQPNLVMGPSSSGKSLLMQALCGRIHELDISGEVIIDSLPINPKHSSASIAYVPQDEVLIGELTARETFRYVALMKLQKPKENIFEHVESIISDLGLSHVADGFIGTPFVRGLSGGEKKRVSIGAELVGSPSILLLDEPTSGLDASIAYGVLRSIREMTQRKTTKSLSVMVSIHQPNNRILELFEHIMLLHGGRMTFFGTLSQCTSFFSDLGYRPPTHCTPTDYFLQILEHNNELLFRSQHRSNSAIYVDNKRNNSFDIEPNEAISFTDYFLNSVYATTMRADILLYKECSIDIPCSKECLPMPSGSHASFWIQYVTLVHREWTVALRDLSLYYFQCIIILIFGFILGAAFFKLDFDISAGTTNVSGALVWIVFMVIYGQVFKVYHMFTANGRFRHEQWNNTYSVFAYWLAEMTVIAPLLFVCYIPGVAIAYFMMGFPSQAFGFIALLMWLVCLYVYLHLYSGLYAIFDYVYHSMLEYSILICLTSYSKSILKYSHDTSDSRLIMFYVTNDRLRLHRNP